MKRAGFKHDDSGSYIETFQRVGEQPLADLAFFDGERTLYELKQLRKLVDDAIKQMEAWNPICKACRGDGRVTPYPSTFNGPCRSCGGSGKTKEKQT